MLEGTSGGNEVNPSANFIIEVLQALHRLRGRHPRLLPGGGPGAVHEAGGHRSMEYRSALQRYSPSPSPPPAPCPERGPLSSLPTPRVPQPRMAAPCPALRLLVTVPENHESPPCPWLTPRHPPAHHPTSARPIPAVIPRPVPPDPRGRTEPPVPTPPPPFQVWAWPPW